MGLLCDGLEDRGRSRLSPYLRIASVGCGPAFEVQQFLTRYPGLGSAVDVTLIDQEEEAIAQCEGVIGPLATRAGAKLTTVRQSMRKLIAADAGLEGYDLVYSAGLFDYLSDRVFRSVLRSLYDTLAPGGRLAVGNVAAGNPSRQAMEPLGLNLFLTVRK